MKLIIGLGNPGREYKNTRHNIGFDVVDKIAFAKGILFKPSKFNADVAEYYYCGEKIMLVKPLSYMNLSGGVLQKLMQFYKIDKKDILVIHDDLDMVIGRIKIIFNSSSGGHNGIKNIEQCIGSREYVRVKVGISNNKKLETKDYVLGNFSKIEMDILNSTYDKLSSVSDDFCDMSIMELMNKYNVKNI